MTFKENIPDLRNTKVMDLIQSLEDFGAKVYCLDPMCDPEEFTAEFGRKLVSWDALPPCEGIVMAVPHNQYRETLPLERLAEKLRGPRALLDIKGLYDPAAAKAMGLNFWRL
jgi:UDP-N-acetyl-D-galactosamine dehydrogenase